MQRLLELARYTRLLFYLGLPKRNIVSYTENSQSPSRWQILRGKLLRSKYSFRERSLLELVRQQKTISFQRGIVSGSISRSIRFILGLILTFILSLVLDELFFDLAQNFEINKIGSLSLAAENSSESSSLNDSVFRLVEIYSGIIGAILGLSFALYIVGFEMFSQGYSKGVTEFANQEPVGIFYFDSLLFALLFNIAVLIRIQLFETPAVVSFLFGTFISVFSLIMIRVYREHHLFAMKSENILYRLQNDFRKSLFAAVRLQTSWRKSNTLMHKFSRDVENSTNLIWNLYEDLVANGDLRTARIAPNIIGQMLMDYMLVKQHFSQDSSWVRNEIKPIDKSDPFLAQMEMQYSIQGLWGMQLPSNDYDWLEKLLLQRFSQMMLRIGQVEGNQKEDLIVWFLMVYHHLLKSEVNPKPESQRLQGLFELQALFVFGEVLKLFIELWGEIKNSRFLTAEYLQIISDTGIAIIDGFDDEEISLASRCLFADNDLIEYQKLQKHDFHLLSHEIVDKYWLKLNVELQVEGRLITPSEIVIQEIIRVLTQTQDENINIYLSKLVGQSDVCLSEAFRSNDFELYFVILRIYLNWLKRLFLQNRLKLHTLFSANFGSKDTIQALQQANPNVFRDLEYWHDLEHVIFFSLYARLSELFNSIILHRMLVYSKVFELKDLEDDRKLLLNRTLLSGGALAYGISELDQDFSWVEFYTERIGLNQDLVNGFREIHDLRPIPNWYEEHSYLMWFGELLEEIRKLPSEYTEDEYGFGRRVFIHPSQFIKQFSPDDDFIHHLMLHDQCIEDYLQWLNDKIAQPTVTPLTDS